MLNFLSKRQNTEVSLTLSVASEALQLAVTKRKNDVIEWIASDSEPVSGKNYAAADTAANPVQCDLGGVNNCAINFVDTGCLLSAPSEATAGDSFNLTIQAVRTDTNAGACVGALDGLQSINIGMRCDDPAVCLETATAGLTTLAEFPATSAVDVTFSSGVANLAVVYGDAGAIDFHVEKTVPAGASLVGNLTTPVVVKPANFLVTVSGAPDLSTFAADYSLAPVFLAAGADFTVTVTARASDNSVTANYGNEAVPQQPTLLSTPAYLLPASGGSVSVAGSWSYQGNVVWSASNVRYQDIGVIALQAQQLGSSYLGAGNVTGQSAALGRFIPAYFLVSELAAPSLIPSQDDFTYLGQPLTLNTFPQLQFEPRTVQGNTISHYRDSLFNYSVDWSDRFYSHSLACDGFAAPSVSFSGSSTAQLNASNDTDGIAEFIVSLSSEQDLRYQQDASVATAPFQACAQLTVPAAALTDSDGVCAKNSAAGNCLDITFSPLQGSEILDGRLRLQAANGASGDQLELEFVLEAFDGTQFVRNQRDNSTLYSDVWMNPVATRFQDFVSSDNLTAADLAPQPLLPTAVSQGERQLVAPLLLEQSADPAKTGSFVWRLSLIDIGLPWLAYAWSDECSPALAPELNPCAPIEFGQFRGNDRIIYIRELGW